MAALRDPCWGLGSVEDVSDMMTFATVWQRHRVATCELARCNGVKTRGTQAAQKMSLLTGRRVSRTCALRRLRRLAVRRGVGRVQL